MNALKDSNFLKSGPRALLVLDSSFSLEAIRTQKLEDSVTCRDLGGYFGHVWTVHPFASLVYSKKWGATYGKLETYELTPKHTFIEGKVGRFNSLKYLAPLNFLLSQIGVLFFLCDLIKKEKINVIRAGDPLYLGLFGWGLSRLCGIPFLVRVGANHDKIYETTRQPLQKRIFFARVIEKVVERFVLRRANVVAGANQDNLNFALDNGARPEFSTLFRYGNLIDKRHFSDPFMRVGGKDLLETLGVTAHQFIIYIGRLEPVKHPDHVLRVLFSIRNRGFDIKALIVGDGSMREDLRALACKLLIADKVVFCGNRDQEWLSLVMPLASAVISPHTGRALSEAALAAAPIVAYDLDWQGELIESGVTGQLVKHGDWEEIAASAERFLCDTVYASRMGIEARNRVLNMMNPSILDQHEREQYSLLFNRRSLPRVIHLLPCDCIGGVESAARTMLNIENKNIFFEVKYIFPTLLSKKKYFGIFNFFELIFTAYKIIRKKPDLLILSLWRSCIVGLLVKMFRPRTPLVLFLHLPAAVHLLDNLFSILVQRLAVNVWADSDATLLQRCSNVKSSNKRVISFVTQRLQKNTDRLVAPNFIFWGRLHPMKGLRHAIQIFAEIKIRFPSANFMVVGPDSGELAEIKEMAEQLKLNNSIKFLGGLEFKEIVNYSGNYSFYLQTSLIEGMAMSVVEAMQLGLVPVVTAVGQIKYYCKDGHNSLIVDSLGATVNKVCSVLRDNEEYQRLRLNAISTWKKIPIYSESVLSACIEIM